MKQKSKYSKIYAILAILALLFLFAFNATYAYFSAMKTLSKQSTMDTFAVNWYGSVQGEFRGSSHTVNPASAEIARGDIIEFENSEIICFHTQGAPAYVRFWLEAKIADDKTDYSNYFELQFYVNDEDEIDETLNVTIVKGLDNAETGTNENLTMYYYDYAIGAIDGSEKTLSLISGIKFDEDAPMNLLGESGLTLTLHFEAVQAGNSAFESYFDDWKGYLGTGYYPLHEPNKTFVANLYYYSTTPTVLKSEPTDWEENYRKYFVETDDGYMLLTEYVEWEKDTYYSLYTLLESEPTDWEENSNNYYKYIGWE